MILLMNREYIDHALLFSESWIYIANKGLLFLYFILSKTELEEETVFIHLGAVIHTLCRYFFAPC